LKVSTLRCYAISHQEKRAQGEIQLIVNAEGRALTPSALRSLFNTARQKFGVSFQFRDLRAKDAPSTDDFFGATAFGAHHSYDNRYYIRHKKDALVAPLYGTTSASARAGKASQCI
jgi:hypothetical protein